MIDGATFMAFDQSENEFMVNVRALAQQRAWTEYHTHIAKRSADGFPDCVMARSGHVLVAELKREKPEPCSPSLAKKLDPTPAQVRWLDELSAVAESIEAMRSVLPSSLRPSQPVMVVRLWRPSDWPEIERVLKGQGIEGGVGWRSR